MRSDKSVRPTNYTLDFDINLENFKFLGTAMIRLELDEDVNEIVLNSADLDIKSCRFEGTENEFELDGENETLTVKTGEVEKGQSELFVEFEGEISDGLAGLYRGRYMNDGEEKFLATTQMEPADARRVFPCFDEPAMKATFDISMTIDKNLTAISNMPVSEENDEGDRKRITFETTPKMSTYLVYLGVGEFEFIEDEFNGTKIRVGTTPGKIEQGKFALESSKKLLEYYNKYFDIDYPLPKLDHIAIPDFAAGAMENWGAVTYREVALLYDPEISSISAKQRIFEVIAHEMAHMWFGNLVTMDWWNDLWLNESFATWMAYKTMAHFWPEWDAWSKFVDEETAGALGLDSLKSSHSIEAKIEDPHDIPQIFDAISYNKGASVLRMLESHIGEKDFREGIRNYMEAHQYDNTVTEDLWSALGEASGVNVKDMMSGWIKQIGYPLVDVDMNGENITLKQKRFILEEGGSEGKWMIPINVKTNGDGKSFIMKDEEHEEEIGEKEFIELNDDRSGFYRTNYSKELLEQLKGLVKKKKIGVLGRWGIQNDLYALSKACEVPFSEYLDFVDNYENEDDYLVCSDIAGHLYHIYRLTSGDFQEDVRKHATKFYKNIMKWLTWDVKEDEHENLARLRSQVLIYLARMGDSWTIQEARSRFNKFLNDPKSLNPNLRGAVYNIVAWDGDREIYEKFKNMYKETNHPEEERRFLSAIAGFSDEEILKDVLDYALSDDIRKQDKFVPVLSVAGNPNGREMVWPWVMKNWSTIEEMYSKGGNIKMFDTFVRPIGMITDIEEEKRINEFFEDKDTSRIDKTLTQSLEKLRINHRFLEHNDAL